MNQLDLKIADILETGGLKNKYSAFADLLAHLNEKELSALFIRLFAGDPWFFDKVVLEPGETEYTPFLKTLLENSSIADRRPVMNVLEEMFFKLLKDEHTLEAENVNKLTQILDITSYLEWELEDSYIHVIFELKRYDKQTLDLKKMAGFVLAKYPLTGKRKVYWQTRIDFNQHNYLIYPYLVAVKKLDYQEIFQPLLGAGHRPSGIEANFQAVLLYILQTIEDRASGSRLIKQFATLRNKFPAWLKSEVKELVSMARGHFPNLFPLVILEAAYDVDAFFEDFKFSTNNYPKEYKYYVTSVYDLNIIDYIRSRSNIADVFNIKLAGFTVNWENFEIEAYRDYRGVDIDCRYLLDTKILEDNLHNITFTDGKDRTIDSRELLIVMPVQLLDEPTREQSIDVAVTNLFQTSFIVNTDNDTLLAAEGDFDRKTLPYDIVGNDLMLRLSALLLKKYKLYGYDAKSMDALDILFNFLVEKYPRGVFSHSMIQSIKGSKEFIDYDQLPRLFGNKNQENWVIATSAPVLAYGIRNNAHYLFNLDRIRDFLKSGRDKENIKKNSISKVNSLFIHTALHTNSSENGYEKLKKEDRRELQRLFSLIAFTVNILRQDPTDYINFIATKENIDVSQEQIEYAWHNCYKYNPIDSYGPLFYAENADFPLPNKSVTSDDIYMDNQKIFYAVRTDLEQVKNSVIEKLKDRNHAVYLNDISERLIQVLTENRFTIDLFHFQNEIVDEARNLFRKAVNKLNETVSPKVNELFKVKVERS